jgi:hypothetical protein
VRAQGFPTILLFAPGNKRAQEPEVFKGARNSDAIAQWALKVLQHRPSNSSPRLTWSDTFNAFSLVACR